MNGGGGEPLQPFGPAQPWTAKRNRIHEFLVVAIDGSRMDVTALSSANSSVLDRFSILRPEISPRTTGIEGRGENAKARPGTPALGPPGPPSTLLPAGSVGLGATSSVAQPLRLSKQFLGTAE